MLCTYLSAGLHTDFTSLPFAACEMVHGLGLIILGRGGNRQAGEDLRELVK